MRSHIEDLCPHVAARLTEVWGSADKANRYLDDLLFSARPERHGFTPETWMELTFLSELIQTHYPPHASGLGTDIWAMTFATGRSHVASAIS